MEEYQNSARLAGLLFSSPQQAGGYPRADFYEPQKTPAAKGCL
jgi:hypothetical protein